MISRDRGSPVSSFACFLVSADFFQNPLFRNIISETLECQTVCIQIRTNIL